MLVWKIGFEVELAAPRDVSREDLARRVATRCGGVVKRSFHQQAEPRAGKAKAIFENLTLGFDVMDAHGARVASFVDDLTLQRDFDARFAPRAGWFRIVADSVAILRLIVRHCDAEAALPDVLAPLAALFGTELQRHTSGMARVVDDRGAPVALAAPLPGERERPCEIVTAPLVADHERQLDELLGDARALGFFAPVEAATHLHFDAAPLCSASVVARLVDVLWRHGDALKALVGANPQCVRLGRWPEALPALTREASFRALDWPAAQGALAALKLSKYCDYNLVNIIAGNPSKHTFEVRVLPAHLEARPIVETAALFEALLRWCCAQRTDETPDTLAALFADLPIAEPGLRRRWLEAACLSGTL